MNLYRDVVVKTEEQTDPEFTVDRVQSITAAVYNLEQVTTHTQRHTCTPIHTHTHTQTHRHTL